MRIEPSIDAFGVKHMVAFGDQSEILIVFEFIETNSALKSTFSDLQTLHHRIHESWECLDHRRVKPSRGSAPPQGAAEAGTDAAGGGRFGAVADVDGEETHEEESADEDDDDDGHGRAEILVRGILWGSVVGPRLRSSRRE